MPPQALVPEIPENLNAVVMRALAKDPAVRYGSAEEFIADLERCRQNLPVTIPAPLFDGEKTYVISPAAAAAGMAGLGAATERTAVQPKAAAAAGEKGSGNKKWLWIILALAAVALAAAGVLFLAFGQGGGGGDVEVPGVVGLPLAQAQDAIRTLGLSPETEAEEFSDTVPAGNIIRQNPEPGARLRENGTVRLVVSKGSNRVAVPSLVGQSVSFAESKLRETGLNPDRQPDVYSASVPAGSIVSQDPAPGTQVQKGSSVKYVVSLGPQPPREVSVPSVVGMNLNEAQARLHQSGLDLGDISEQESDSVPAGEIISQNPAAGQSVNEGSVVSVVVSKGSAPEPIQKVSVPTVTGMQQAAAENLITSAGLVPSVTTEPAPNPGQAGKVKSQDPAGGTQVEVGSTVSIVVWT